MSKLRRRLPFAFVVAASSSTTACVGSLTAPPVVVQPAVVNRPAPVSSALPSASSVCQGEIDKEVSSLDHAVDSYHPPGPQSELKALFLPKKKAGKKAAGTVSLGTIRVMGERPRAQLPIFLAWRSLPTEVVVPGLPEAERAAWERLTESRKNLRKAYARRQTTERKLDECKQAKCPELACLENLLLEVRDREVPLAKSEHAKALADMIRMLEDLGKSPKGEASPAVPLALAWLTEGVDDGINPNGPARMRAIGLLKTARSAVGPSEPLGWYARYFLGLALADADVPAEAEVEWKALDQAPVPSGCSRIEPALRIAELATHQTDPKERVASWRQVARKCPSQLVPVDGNLCVVAGYGWMAAAYEAGEWRSAIVAAAQVLSWIDQSGDPPNDMRVEASSVLADSLDSFGGEDLASLPSIPTVDMQRVAGLVSQKARRRFDYLAAQKAWRVAHPSDEGSLHPSTPVDPKRELAGKIGKVVLSCSGSTEIPYGEYDADGDGQGRLRMTPRERHRPVLPAAFKSCLATRAPWYLSDSPFAFSATVDFAP